MTTQIDGLAKLRAWNKAVSQLNEAAAITPESWLAMLPDVVKQMEPEQHEKFVTDLLRQLDRLGVEMAGCVADEIVVARNWF